MNTERQYEQSIAERAAQLLAEMQSGSAQGRMQMSRWLRQSPLHVREVLVATAWEQLMSCLDPEHKHDIARLMELARRTVTPISGDHRELRSHDGAGEALPQSKTVEPIAITNVPALHERVAPGTRKLLRWAIGIAAAAGVAVAIGLMAKPAMMNGVAPTEQYSTEIGEQRTLSLMDGSIVYLNTQSRARVAFSEGARDIYLEGQATFNVAHDASRPFRVHANHVQVQAIGTQFDVKGGKDRTDVAVIDGLVKITAEEIGIAPTQSANADLPAGKGMSIMTGGVLSAAQNVEVASILAWRHRRLVSKGHTLVQIAAEFNRYNKAPKIRIEGEALQAKRYSGIFDVDDPQSFLDYLAQDRQLAVERRGGEFVVIRMRSSYAAAEPAN